MVNPTGAASSLNAVYGTDLNDTLYGTDGDDGMMGYAGDDTLYGRKGDDHIWGASGNDELHGGEGNDTLIGGDGEDSLLGDEGNDVLIWGHGDIELDGGEGYEDVLDATEAGIDFDNVENIRSLLDILDLDPSNIVRDISDNYIFSFKNADSSFTLSYGDKESSIKNIEKIKVDKETGFALLNFNKKKGLVDISVDNHAAMDNENIQSVEGTNFNDYIVGDDEDNTINGNTGNDAIFSGDGNNVIDGGAGDDHIEAGRDNDVIDGGAGDDNIDGGDGDDTLDGGEGDDILTSRYGDDNIDGGDGDDTLVITNREIDFSNHEDNIKLASVLDMDSISYNAEEGTYTIFVKDPNISFTISDPQDASTLSVANIEKIIVNSETGELLSKLNPASGLFDIEIAEGDNITVGTNFGDMIVGDDESNIIDAKAGNDVINSGNGDDEINGGHGDDYIFGYKGNDEIDGGEGSDIILGGEGNDTILGDWEDLNVDGGDDDDTFVATHMQMDDETIERIAELMGSIETNTDSEGNSIINLNGTVSALTLTNDNQKELTIHNFEKIKVTEHLGQKIKDAKDAAELAQEINVDDHFNLNDLSDRYDLSGFHQLIVVSELAELVQSGDIDINDKNDVVEDNGEIYINLQNVGDLVIHGLSLVIDNDWIRVSSDVFEDLKSVVQTNNSLYGLDGEDDIRGGDKDDQVLGGSGHDILYGGGGDDILLGGEGDDELRGGDGDDTFLFEFGSDTVLGGSGTNRLIAQFNTLDNESIASLDKEYKKHSYDADNKTYTFTFKRKTSDFKLSDGTNSVDAYDIKELIVNKDLGEYIINQLGL
ncbi:MAG: hypothetical protein AAF228_07545 [Pseudomonadota bacterium]